MNKRNQKKFVWLNQKAKRGGGREKKREWEAGRETVREGNIETEQLICNKQCKNRAYSSSLSSVAEAKIRQEG